MADSDVPATSARGRKPHLAESVRRYTSSGSRRPERSRASTSALSAAPGATDRAAGSGGSGGSGAGTPSASPSRVRVVPGQAKAMSNCCRLELLPEDLASNLAKEVKKQVMDMADLVINPLGAGPFQLAKALEERQAKQLEDLDRVDRLWEFRLCVEMLRDCLDSYNRHGERDMLSTAEETLSTAEELLRRVTELAVMHIQSDEAFLDSISQGPQGLFPQDDSGLLMQVLQSPDFQEKGGLTRSLLSSRLMISGLLESVVGELTRWRSHPSEADLEAWKRWDRTYERLARRVAAVQQSQQAKSAPGGDSLWRCMEVLDPAAPLREETVECVACRNPACAPLCGYGQRA